MRCDTEEVVRREAMRGDRPRNLALWQVPRVHAGVRYDFEVDTITCPSDAAAEAIIAFVQWCRCGIACIRPTAIEREETNRIIMDELVYGVFKPEAVAYYQKVIERMRTRAATPPSWAAPRFP